MRKNCFKLNNLLYNINKTKRILFCLNLEIKRIFLIKVPDNS